MKRSIYFSERHGDFVADEMCVCGHLKSEHGSKLTPLGEGIQMRDAHEGSCCAGSCDCRRFDFSRVVLLDEAADLAISRRPLELA